MSTLVLELSSLGLALLVLETLGISIVSLLVLVTGLALLSIAVIDWQTYLIPDAPVLVAALCGLLLLTFDGSLMQERFAAGMLFPLFLWLVGKGTSLAMGRASLGFGDVKLVGALGMLLGLMNGFLAIWIAALLGLLYRVSGIRSEEPRIPFGALMAISAEGILLAEYGIIDIPWIAWN
jgi:leader peptidase (prepilin peptidase)/N-methyltransferase